MYVVKNNHCALKEYVKDNHCALRVCQRQSLCFKSMSKTIIDSLCFKSMSKTIIVQGFTLTVFTAAEKGTLHKNFRGVYRYAVYIEYRFLVFDI